MMSRPRSLSVWSGWRDMKFKNPWYVPSNPNSQEYYEVHAEPVGEYLGFRFYRVRSLPSVLTVGTRGAVVAESVTMAGAIRRIEKAGFWPGD